MQKTNFFTAAVRFLLPAVVGVLVAVPAFAQTPSRNKSEGKNGSPKLYIQGTSAFMNERYPEAIASFTQAIKLDPTYARAYMGRGMTYDSMKQYVKALADYNKSIQLDATYADTYYQRGDTYKKLKQYDKALADLKKAQTLHPNEIIADEIKQDLNEVNTAKKDAGAAKP